MPPSKLNSTLESNLATAFIPRFPIFDRLAHLGECIFTLARGALRCLCRSRPAPPPVGLRPPGDVATGPVVNERLGDDNASRAARQTPVGPAVGFGLGDHNALRAARPLLIHSRETLKDLPTLSGEDAGRALKYDACSRLAYKSKNIVEARSKEFRLKNIRDAFDEKISSRTDGGDDLFLLPKEVRESSLLNKGYPGEGEISTTKNNLLIDRKTGFCAGICYDPNQREVIISFPPPGTHDMTVRQYFRGIMQWLGFVPKTLSQASKLTRLVRDHIDAINENLPEEQKVKLTLTGHCMGGAMASYAALRNKVPAIVTNPLRLGHGARARVGEVRLQEAEKYLTEIVVQGDWAADNRWAWLYAPLRLLGVRSFGPLGTARRFMVPYTPPGRYSRYRAEGPHRDVESSLKKWEADSSRAHNLKVFCPWLEDAEIAGLLKDNPDGLVSRIEKMIVKKIGRRHDAGVHGELVKHLTNYVEQCLYEDTTPQSNLESRLREPREGIQKEIEIIQSKNPRAVPGFCREIFGSTTSN